MPFWYYVEKRILLQHPNKALKPIFKQSIQLHFSSFFLYLIFTFLPYLETGNLVYELGYTNLVHHLVYFHISKRKERERRKEEQRNCIEDIDLGDVNLFFGGGVFFWVFWGVVFVLALTLTLLVLEGSNGSKEGGSKSFKTILLILLFSFCFKLFYIQLWCKWEGVTSGKVVVKRSHIIPINN